jgi:hypothetical protein
MKFTSSKSASNLIKKTQKLLSLMVAFLFAVNASLFAAVPTDSLLSPLEPQQPTTTLSEATETTSQTTSQTASEAEDFFLAGPLSASTPETMSLEAATTGRTLYVSKTGSDTASGSETSPYKTLQKAISQLQAGDTLVIREGVYNESADMVASGTVDAYITIRGEGNVVIDGEPLNDYEPIFDTKGFDYIRFENLTVNNSRDAVEVSPGSQYVVIDGLKTNNNHFAVKINSASNITVRNVVAANSRNAFRTENNGGSVPSNILFENIEAYGSKDIYTGYETRYRNGDGFILEAGNNITLRNIKSHDHWDGGFDIKASNVLVENTETWGNKNNFKIWGQNVVVKNSVIRNARYMADDPVAGEGNGVNARTGSVTFINTTFVDNDSFDIKVDNDGGPSRVTLQNSIVARKKSGGELFTNVGGTFIESNNLIYWQGSSSYGFTLNSTSATGNPAFVNWDGKDFRLTSSSPAIDLGSNSFPITSLDLAGNTRVTGDSVDAGAYEVAGNTPTPDTTVPVISAVTAAGITQTAATITWLTNEASDSQVEYRIAGTTAWQATSVNAALLTTHSVVISGLTAGTAYEFRVKSKDGAGNLATQAAISNFTTLLNPTPSPSPSSSPSNAFQEVGGQAVMEAENLLSTTTVNGQTWNVVNSATQSGGKTLQSGPDLGTNLASNTGARADYKVKIDSPGTYYVWIRGTVTDGNNDSLHVGLNGQVVSGGTAVGGNFPYNSSSWTNKNMQGTRVSFTVTQAGEYTINLWMREDGFQADKILLTKNSGFVPTGLGPAESARVSTTPSDTAAPVISAVASANVTTNSAAINWTTNENSDSQVEYRVKGTTTWQATTVNSSMVTAHSATLSGLLANTEYEFRVKSKDQAGNLATQATLSTFKTAAVVTTGDFVGVTNGQTLSGTVNIGPNMTAHPGISKVAYYLNGTQSGKVYSSPFLWGGTSGNGTAGFDTKTLANGTYTLAMVYGDATGDHEVQVSFTVNNSAITPTPSPSPTVLDYVGVTNGQTVTGIVNIGPNLTRLTSISKVAYYLNGTKSGKVYSSPFYWGGVSGNGTSGFDTRTLANGTYTLALVYSDSTGDHTIPISFIVNN